MAPSESVAGAASVATAAPAPGSGIDAFPLTLDPALLAELFRASDAAAWGLTQSECAQILLEVGTSANFGLAAGDIATHQQQANFYRALRLPDLVLARACAYGHQRAWQHFVSIFRQPLIRSAIAITGSETLGCDFADQLYAELYGLTTQNGERRCPLASYRGRGSLMGWLRTTLAQRHVDHHRRTHREEPLEELDAPAPDQAQQGPSAELAQLERATKEALRHQSDEDRFLLAAYFLDGQKLLQIARTLGVHEATISRRLQRATIEIRKQVLRNLEQSGLSRRAAEELLGSDPRDLDLNLKILLQKSQADTIKEQAAS
ncbi:MAG: sigma-70 family RNA polymerase sigma factor [Terracidiphilus sp.]